VKSPPRARQSPGARRGGCHSRKVFQSIQATKFMTKRVHQEVATEGMGRGKRVDILVLKDGEAELVGYNYRPGVPSTIFRDQDVIGAIEVKFFRDTDVRPKILRAGEVKSYQESINKLGIIKRKNAEAFCALVVFSHCCLRFRHDQEKRLAHLSKSAKLDLVYRTEVASFETGTV
jgi:hypothetical protein